MIDWHLLFDILKAMTPFIVGIATFYFKGIRDDLTEIKKIVSAWEQRLAVNEEKFTHINQSVAEVKDRLKTLEHRASHI